MKINLETHTQRIFPTAERHWLKTNQATPNKYSFIQYHPRKVTFLSQLSPVRRQFLKRGKQTTARVTKKTLSLYHYTQVFSEQPLWFDVPTPVRCWTLLTSPVVYHYSNEIHFHL